MKTGPITALIPRPRHLRLGGTTFKVSPLRLRDLADLQSWLDEQWPDPLEGVRRLLGGHQDGGDPATRRVILSEAYDLAELGPPSWGDERANRLFATPEGICIFVLVALRRDSPGMTAEAAVRLAAAMTAEEYASLRRVAFGIEPIDEIERLMGYGPSDGATVPWPQAIEEVAVRHGWTYPEIYELTLAEFANARGGGRQKVRGRVVGPGENLADVLARARRELHVEEGAHGSD